METNTTGGITGFDVLKQNAMVDPAKIAVIGYCFGGTVGSELAETGIPAMGTVAVQARSATSRQRRRRTSKAGC